MTSRVARFAVLALLASAGCHLLFPFSVQNPDGPPADAVIVAGDAARRDLGENGDTASLFDGRPLDHALADALAFDQLAKDQATPDAGLFDAAPIDLVAADSPGTYYFNEEFNGTMGSLTGCWGTWQASAGAVAVTQSDLNTWGSFASGPALPGSDYVAETRLTILNHGSYPLLSFVGGALSFRVQTPCVASKPPRGYFCMVTPALPGLILGTCDNGGKCSALNFQSFSVSKAAAYRVRVTAKGDNLTCELPDHAVSLASSDSVYTSGDVALATFFAEVSFDYLKAWATP